MKADIIVKSIIFNRKLNKILLLQRASDDDTGAGTWENAGGNMENGESLDAAVLREVREETGITDIVIGNVAYVTLFRADVLIIVYYCEAMTDIVTISNEHQAYMWADKNDCLNILPQGIIEDLENNKVFEHLGM